MKKIITYFKDQGSKANVTHNIIRLLILGLLVFEMLNILKILNFSPQFTWRGLLSTSLIGFIILEIIAYFYYKKKNKANLHGSVWIFTFIVIFLDFTADIFHLYNRFTWWDQSLHLISSGLICFILFVIISAFWLDKFQFKIMPTLQRLHLALFMAATSALALGALYEIEEYTEDLIYGTQRSGPGTDTPNDLSFNAMGITLVTLILWVVLSKLRKKSKLLS